MSRGVALAIALVLPAAASAAAEGEDDPGRRAIDRAVGYLAREVPAWRSENGCFSCHNTGDGARALAIATRRGVAVPAGSLESSLAWLGRPSGWDREKVRSDLDDPSLSRLQYASALLAAREAGLVVDESSLREAASLLAEKQDADGSFHPDGPDTLGGPTTYGRELSTWLALGILRAASRPREAARTRAWLEARPIRSTEQAAVVLLSGQAGDRRDRARRLLAEGQGRTGGWGPYPSSPPEVFDTALVLLGLHADPGGPGHAGQIERGRTFLLSSQEPDGGWPETTRPTGGESYAQRVSTTSWALIALMETRPGPPAQSTRNGTSTNRGRARSSTLSNTSTSNR